jgi:hypothetical protein
MCVRTLCIIILVVILVSIIVILAGEILWCICNNKQRNLRSVGETQTIVTTDRIGKKGQLGNQLFQLAAAYSAAKDNDCKNIMSEHIKSLPLWNIFSDSLQDHQQIFNYDIGVVKGKRSKWRQLLPYEPIKLPSHGHIIDTNGYFEDIRYFEAYRDDLKTIFKPNDELLNAVKAALPERYIAIHIRNTDNVTWYDDVPILGFFASRHHVSFKYYKKGIKYLRSKLGKLPIYICTDNPKWVSENIHLINKDAQLMPSIPHFSSISVDFCALYLATGAVIWASTFSWWTSYLGNNELVVRPYPIWIPGTAVEIFHGIRGEHQHHSKMVELDYMTGEIVDIKDNPDNYKAVLGWSSYSLGS